MKLPKVSLNPKLPRFLCPSTYKIKHHRLLRIWRKFFRQIPREFRSTLKTHQHFLLMGDEKSGKTDLVQGIIEQSQSIYPFEVEYTKSSEIQFYLGPKQIVQELSLAAIQDRTVELRRSIIHLWKRLYAKEPPIVVISYNPFSESAKDLKEVNRLARLIAGKLTLLSQISKSPLNVRISLTHLDKIKGYLPLAQFIKQHNITFEIPLTSDFESETLQQSISQFRDEYLSLILTSTSAENYMEILHFFNEVEKLFSTVEEFLRILTSGEESPVELEKLTFASNCEPYTSFSSFDWAPTCSNSIFFRHPMLKHQVASGALLLVCLGLVLNNFNKDRKQISLSQKGVNSILLMQPEHFVSKVIPKIETINRSRPQEKYLSFLPRFYQKKLRNTNQALAYRIRQHILEPTLRRLILKKSDHELSIIYMLGLLHATKDNPLGEHILENTFDWAKATDLDESLITSFVHFSNEAGSEPIQIDYIDQINISTPLTDTAPWIEFLERFKHIVSQSILTSHDPLEIKQEASSLLSAYRKIKNDPHAFKVASFLKGTSSRMLDSFEKNMKLLTWINEEKDSLEQLLTFICDTYPNIPNISELNISEFFTVLQDVAKIREKKCYPYKTEIKGKTFEFNPNQWVNLSVTHIIEDLIHKYDIYNRDTQGSIFFKRTAPLADIIFDSYRKEFPYFKKPIVIPGRFSRLAFEKNVRGTTESLLSLLDDLPINSEDKDRFQKFVHQEVDSYAKQYQKEYERVYEACDIRSGSLEDILEILGKISEPNSSLHLFLDNVYHHTSAFSDPTSCLSNLEDINHFYFLIPLMKQEKNELSPFAEYQKILKEAHLVLKGKKTIEGIGPLEHHLTPAAALSLSILRKNPQSYKNQIINSLLDIDVPSRYHHLFLAPIMEAYRLGIKDLKVGIEQLWKKTLSSQLEALFAKRPFNPDGAFAATYNEVEKMTNPHSEFFQIITELISPASTYTQGQWIPDSRSDLQLAASIYTAANRLAKISQLLWDTNGEPQPLHMQVQALPFSKKEKTYPAPVVSYLVTGEEQLYNFNQTPSWYSIKVEWWKESNSSVVMELANKNDNRSYRDEKVTQTLWSFFDLLKKANQIEENVWVWSLENEFGEDISEVALRFEASPWNLFQLKNP